MKSMKKSTLYIMAAAAMTVFAACSGQKGWKVEGNVEGADSDQKIVLQGFNAGNWYTVDSLAIGADGSFAYASEQGAQFPDIYRLNYAGESIYFPIDSIETVTVEAKASSFGSDYVLDGTPQARAMMEIDRKIASVVSEKGVQAALADSLLKRDLNQAVLDDSIGVLSYYIINKTLGGQPMYSPADRRDVAMLGATAQKFSQLLPSDPRTKYLERRYLSARQAINPGKGVTIEAQEVSVLDIDLYDEKGQKHSLAEVAGKGNPVILCFTAYNTEASLPYNVELNRLYEAYRGQNLQIYQVAFDSDERAWRETAANLPWITVRNNPTDGDKLLRTYNVGMLPISFVINRQGEVVERVADPTALESSLRKVL